MKNKKHYIVYFFLLSTFLLSFIYYNIHSKTEKNKEIRDLSEIIEEKTLRVVTTSNFIDYFVYNGTPMGFYLEMLQDFANKYNLNLEIITETDFSKSKELLTSRKCDIYACNAFVPMLRTVGLKPTIPIRETCHVLIQRKPDFYWLIPENQIQDSLIKDIKKIGKDTIFTNDINLKLSHINIPNITVLDSVSIEQIVKNISNKTFNYAILDYESAKVFKSYYHNIDIDTELSKNNKIRWFLRPESVELLDSINIWLAKYKENKKYVDLENKYIQQSRILLNLRSEYYSGNEGKISIYDHLIKEYSKNTCWDWRLIASLIYEESRFDPEAVSWAGAIGLMQLMPYTYFDFSTDSTWAIESQLLAGTKYIDYLSSLVPDYIEDSVTKIKMILAGYNIGFGHIEDAINLADKYKKDPSSWDNISYYLTNLSNSKYYTDSVVKFGYFPGIHAVSFANSIYDRFLHYKNVIPE